MLGRAHCDCQHQSSESVSILQMTRMNTIQIALAAAAWKPMADDLASCYLREMCLTLGALTYLFQQRVILQRRVQ